MIWHEPSLLIILICNLALTLSFMMLYFTNERQKYLFVWTAAWFFYLLRSLILATIRPSNDIAIYIIPVTEVIAIVNSYLLLHGVYLYNNKKIHRTWLILALCTSLWILLTPHTSMNFITIASPPALFLFATYSYTGYLFIKGIKYPAIERIITGILLIIWGVHRLDFPFFWPDEKLRFAGYITGATLNILISFFILITYLQDTRRRFISEKLRAEEADRLKSTFLANMSHEIRTPLNAILGFAQLLSKPDLTIEDKDIFVKNIKSSGERLLSLLDDLLDLSKIEAGMIKVYISSVSINKLVDDLISLFSLSRRVIEKNLNLVVEKPLSDGEDAICTDETRLFQILSNLLNNAIKFTEQGTITTGYELSEQGYIRFYVKDTGIGISKDALHKIFTPFFQEGKIPAAGGTGLGLSIVKGLTESLGGIIDIESAVNQGTEISFTIPFVKSEERKLFNSYNGTPESYNITGKKILLVEDEPVNRRLMEKFIESTGAELISTESGNESVKLCAEDSKIDLVLMDLTLPDIDGYTAMEMIRKIRPQLPMVAQSATSMAEHRERARNAGADDFIAKPIKKEELYNAIWKQLYGREGN